ncbi:hypothetical protein C8R44DRAFT_890496 [Mycena epipterygia]|nr:hypothetical protein C8R44DRAFT_890496 [Mycena epipterygia]
MAPKPWADVQQLAWLHLQMPDYIQRQAEDKLQMFWDAMEEAWFARFPEQHELGLPLLNEPNALVLTREQVQTLGDAIQARKKQLASWFRREHAKIRGARDHALENEKREVARQHLEEEQRRVKNGKMPRQYQEGIDSLENLFKDAHLVGHEMSGWVGVTIVGGPTPRLGGVLTFKLVCFGETTNGNNFETLCADFDKTLGDPFGEFLRQVFSVAECKERAIVPETGAAEGDTGVQTTTHVDDSTPPVAAKPKPRRVARPKPKAKKKKIAKSTPTSITTPSSTTTSSSTPTATAAESSGSPISVSATAPGSGSETARLSVSPTLTLTPSPPPASTNPTPAFGAGPASKSPVFADAARFSRGDTPIMATLEAGLSPCPGVDGAFGVPFGGSGDDDPFMDGGFQMQDNWWTAADEEWAGNLTHASSPAPSFSSRELSPSLPASGAPSSPTRRALRPCFKGAPYRNTRLVGGANDVDEFFTDVSRGSGRAGPQTPRGSSGAYPRSILLQAFDGGRGSESPIAGSAPASLRRKAWSSPLRLRPSVPFVSRVADAMAGILAIVHAPTTAPTPPPMTTTATPAAAPQPTPPTVTPALAPAPAPAPRTTTLPAATSTMTPTTSTKVLTTTSTTGPAAAEHVRASAATAGDADQDDDGYPQSRPTAKMPKPPGVRRGVDAGEEGGEGEGAGVGVEEQGEQERIWVGEQREGEVAGAPAAEPVLVYTVGNETMKFNRQVEARRKKEALEKEQVKQAAALTPTVVLINPDSLPERRSRRATVMRDGSAAARVVKNVRPRTNPNAASEAALLARGTAVAEGKKRKAGAQEPGAEPPAKRPRGRPRKAVPELSLAT